MEKVSEGLKFCRFCGEPFEGRRGQLYCTRKCGDLYNSPRVLRHYKTCLVCGNSFMRTARAVYCSSKCQQEARAIARGFRKTEDQWKNLREFVIERDNFTCQDCGEFLMDIGLEAHHIKPLFKGGTNQETNLITLCHKCHKYRHQRL